MEGCLFEYNPEESEVSMTENRIQNTACDELSRVEHRPVLRSSTEAHSKSKVEGAQIIDFNKKKNSLGSEKGIALVMALIISLTIMMLVAGVLYFTIQSTSISGAGKRYSTAEEAADGAVEIIKEGINSVQRTDPVPNIINDPSDCFVNATITRGVDCTTLTINLPGTVGTYTATATLQNLFTVALPGSRIEFARAGGIPATAVYYRIIVNVTDPTNTIKAENSVLYRYTG